MIDGVIYYIGVADQTQNNIPTVIFEHREDETLKEVKNRLMDTVSHPIFFGEQTANETTQEYQNVNAGFGKCAYGPLKVKDNKRSDPITYYKDIFIGQVKEKDGNRILLQGTKVEACISISMDNSSNIRATRSK